MSAIKLTNNNYNEVVGTDKPVLIDFYADWCGPCRMVGPIIDEIASEREDIVVAKVNVDSERELSAKFGVVSIPTLAILKGGKVVHQSSGARPKAAILKLLESV